ncbi:MAG: cyclic nucleotide-binding domain-containing protein [Alphaproteobacteria bacterium]|nr:cyclic nucleotide-binding domain-containing protein [Alphaproteobacteria bacterium]
MSRFTILPDPRRQNEARLTPCAACEVRDLAICGVLNGAEIERVGAIVSNVRVEGGEVIFFEGDDAEHVFNIVAGVVRLFKLMPDGRRQVTGFLYPADFLGLALSATYAYSAEAVTPVRLCRFPRGKLERLLEEIPRLEKRLLGNAANELMVAQDQMLLLGRKTAKERLASFLMHLSSRAERRGETADPIALPMSRTDIADYLGLTIETVSRTFTRLRKDGLIDHADPHVVHVLDRGGLEELAGL